MNITTADPAAWMLSELQAKFGEDAKVPTHSVGCGIYWDATCLECLRKWEGHERQKEIPRAVQVALRFRKLAP